MPVMLSNLTGAKMRKTVAALGLMIGSFVGSAQAGDISSAGTVAIAVVTTGGELAALSVSVASGGSFTGTIEGSPVGSGGFTVGTSVNMTPEVGTDFSSECFEASVDYSAGSCLR
jgi:hypothetical protein